MLKIKRLDPAATLPTVAHPGTDLGFDLYALEATALPPGVPVKVRTGIAVEAPAGFGLVLGDRSSMAARGITYMGGRIDAGYRGELLICLVNVNQPALALTRNADGLLTDASLDTAAATLHIAAGDKIAQISPLSVHTSWPIVEVDQLADSARAAKGFGSSGR